MTSEQLPEAATPDHITHHFVDRAHWPTVELVRSSWKARGQQSFRKSFDST